MNDKRYLVLGGSLFAPRYLRQAKRGPTGPKQEWTLHGPDAVELTEEEALYEQEVAGGIWCGVCLEEVVQEEAAQ